MTTATISKKLNNEMKTFVIQAINEVLNDPDFGMELTEKAGKRLKKEQISKKKNISFSDIKKKYL